MIHSARRTLSHAQAPATPQPNKPGAVGPECQPVYISTHFAGALFLTPAGSAPPNARQPPRGGARKARSIFILNDLLRPLSSPPASFHAATAPSPWTRLLAYQAWPARGLPRLPGARDSGAHKARLLTSGWRLDGEKHTSAGQRGTELTPVSCRLHSRLTRW
jgi:hypothetical protein